MKLQFRDLWRPSGVVGRGTYALVGVLGFALKHNLDRFIATLGFHRPWSIFNYWEPLHNVGSITHLHGNDAKFVATLVATALPFIWVGIMMTLKRLRSIGAPLALVILFFIPFLNLIFFLVLSLVPSRELSTTKIAASSESPLARFIPDNAFGSAGVTALITVLIGLGATLLGTLALRTYGWGLFVALPFAMGLSSAAIHGIRRPRSMGSCIAVAALSVALLGAALFALAIEGVICLIMALPLAMPLAIAGGVCGYFVQRRGSDTTAPAYVAVLLVFTPGMQWVEHVVAPKPQLFVVRSSVEINASPEEVWQRVVAFTEIPPPRELLFRAGIAYPIRAEISGSGAGAERRCVFSTGAFVEPIQIWDEPHRLKFSVTENPAPMEEWTPYRHIQPPHLHGFLRSEGGQFLLTPLANGGTRLEGTTWYRHGLWPAEYWQLWSDRIIHRIHMRVLNHIKEQAEKKDPELRAWHAIPAATPLSRWSKCGSTCSDGERPEQRPGSQIHEFWPLEPRVFARKPRGTWAFAQRSRSRKSAVERHSAFERGNSTNVAGEVPCVYQSRNSVQEPEGQSIALALLGAHPDHIEPGGVQQVGATCVHNRGRHFSARTESQRTKEHSVKGKVVLVTGASGGLGTYVVQAFLDAGDAVIGTSRKIRQSDFSHAAFAAIPGEISSADVANLLVTTVLDRFGKVDVLAHTVGGFAGGQSVAETDDATFQRVFDLNVNSSFNILRAAIPALRKSGSGRIIAIGSRAAVEPGANVGAYSASKAALVSLIKTVAAENRDAGVTANVILPGTMDTPANRMAMPGEDFSKWVNPANVASLAVWLASESGKEVNGAAIPIYGNV